MFSTWMAPMFLFVPLSGTVTMVLTSKPVSLDRLTIGRERPLVRPKNDGVPVSITRPTMLVLPRGILSLSNFSRLSVNSFSRAGSFAHKVGE